MLLKLRIRQFIVVFLASILAVIAVAYGIGIGYNTPPVKLQALPAQSFFTIEADGLGWFRMIQDDGSVPFTSTNPSSVINFALGNITSGSVYVREGDYSNTNVVVQAKKRLILETGAKGIIYSVQPGGFVTDYNIANPIDTNSVVDPSNYIVYVSGSTYYMVNGSTGRIDFSSTNASAVFNFATGNLTSGGTISIKSGRYVLSSPINVGPGITYSGTFGYYGYGSNLLTMGPVSLFQYTGSTPVPFVVLRNMYIQGGKTGAYGVYFNSLVQDVRIEDVYVSDFANDGIFIGNAWGLVASGVVCERNGGNGLNMAGSYSGRVIGGKFNNNLKNGVYLGASDSQLIGCDILENNQNGVDIAGSRNVITGCRIGGNSVGTPNVYSDIYVERYSQIIYANDFTAASNEQFNIRLNANNCTITGNHFQGALTGVLSVAGTGHKVALNDGYNPQGYLANAFTASSGNLGDSSGGQAYPSNNAIYTVNVSPKLITVYGGAVSAIYIDGQNTGLTSGAFRLEPLQTFRVVWSVQPGCTVYRC